MGIKVVKSLSLLSVVLMYCKLKVLCTNVRTVAEDVRNQLDLGEIRLCPLLKMVCLELHDLQY